MNDFSSSATDRLLSVGIDACRNRSGGTRAHLHGLLGGVDPRDHGIGQVHLWSHAEMLKQLPDPPWLMKHGAAALQGSMLEQLRWQRYALPQAVRDAGCDIVLTTDAGSVSTVRPSIAMSRDLLPFEPREAQRYGWSRQRLRIALLKWLSVRALRHADGALFLTAYAAQVIQRSTGPLKSARIVPHGVGDAFRQPVREPQPAGVPLRCVYVSNADMYKHQWHVVAAVAALRAEGVPLRLTLIGGGEGRPQQLLTQALQRHDPQGAFVHQLDFVPHDRISGHLAEADIFIYASSCENMPNTLVEAMASGLPVACSDRGPMPEILRDGGLYFDPESPTSIAAALRKLAQDPVLRLTLAGRAQAYAAEFSWTRCARETWSYLADTAHTAAARRRQPARLSTLHP